jgi:uncharacterized protein with ParB-like and HNH nuclease domain
VNLDSLSQRNYFIPSYQRGYRWGKQQVKELLDDILDYANGNGLGSGDQGYYCLQPVVVKSLTDEEKRRYDLEVDREWYEVIDGQQRLTTLALIRHYFNEHFTGKSKHSEPTIKYETRQTHINKVSIDDGGDVVCEGVDRSSNIDLYHVVNAYGYIHEWFQSFLSSGGSVNKIMLAFNEHVRVIWYQIDEQSGTNTDAIELFTRINMGKIPLTNAELIKALFLRQRNFKDNQSLRQVEIAKEWDSIEYALQNDGVWYFLNNEGEDKPARIEYIFDMMYDSEHNRAEAEGRKDEFDKLYGTDAYKTFRFFAYKFKDDTADAVKRYWEEVMGAFSAIREWYDDNKYYHYIGYLIACGVRIVDVYSMYHNAPKSAFLQRIKDSICEVIKDVKYGVDERGEVYVDLQYGKDNNLIRRVLLLFNVEYIVKHSRQDEQGYMRFPFDLYKKMDWDIEHINSYTTNEISKGDAQVAWINTALGDMKSAGFDVEAKNGDLYEKIEDFLRRPRSKTFYELKAEIVRFVGEYDSGEDEATKNNIGNLTLLNADINRSYGNALFITKRGEIIARDKMGSFIPICTKNVFLKYFDKEGSSKSVWSKGNGDYDNYLKDMVATIEEFLNKQGEQHEE